MNQVLKKTLRYLLYSILIVLLIINSLFTIAANHIQYFHQYLAEYVSNSIGGTYSFEKTKIKWNNFTTDFRLETYNTQIFDTLYEQHHKRLLNIGNISSNMSFWSILSNDIDIQEVILKDVEFNLFVDSNGYTNSYLFGSKKDRDKEEVKSKGKNINIKKLNLENIRVSITQSHRDKAIEFDIKSLSGNIEQSDSLLTANITTDAFIHQLGFNLEKGPFLENQPVHIPYTSIHFDKIRKRLELDTKKILVDDQNVFLSMLFDFHEVPGTYDIKIIAPEIDFGKGLTFINRHLRRFLGKVDFDSTLSVQVALKGSLKPKDKPYVKALFFTHNNNMFSEFGNIKDVSIQGMYYNNYEDGKGYNDFNSIIYISKLQGLYNDNIPVFSDSIFVHNLKDPYLDAKIQTSTKVDNLNTFFGKSMSFKNGAADVRLHFRGHIAQNKVANRTIDGYIKIRNADFVYHSRNWHMNNINVTGEFNRQDFILKNVSAQKGKSKLQINGKAENFLNAYFDNPELIRINLNLYSDFLDLNDIMSLAVNSKVEQEKTQKKTRTQPKKIQEINNRIDNILALGTLNLNMNMKKIQYNNFLAYNNRVNVDFLPDKIKINRAELEQSQGHIQLQGEVLQSRSNNPFHIEGYISEVDISEFFYSMDNFKMKTLTSDNLRGSFNAQFSVDGKFTDNGQFLSKSLSGFLNFELNDGALVRFGPLAEIGKYIFKNRHLDSISFHKIHNHLIFENGKVLIFPMSIQSSILNIDLQGLYSFESGTDISIHIPLFNRNNKQPIFKLSKFLSLNLRARDDEDGKVKIGWDPNLKGGNNLNDYNFRNPSEEQKKKHEEASEKKN